MNLRQHSIFAALSALACSELAGFEEFRGDPDETSGGSAGLSGRGGASGTGPSSSGTGASAGDDETQGGEPSSPAGGGGATGMAGAGTPAGGRATAGSGGSSGTGGTGNGSGNAGTAGTASPGGCGELLTNADFEGGATVWYQESTWPSIDSVEDVIVHRSDSRLAGAPFTAPPSGNYVAWLGGIPNSESIYRIGVLQDLVIPEDTTSIVLSGQIQIKTEEDQSREYDRITMSLEDEQNAWEFDNNPDPSVLVLSNMHPTTGWVAFSSTLDATSTIAALRGRAVYLRLESRTDQENVTSFWLDSLSLVAQCER